MRIKGTVCIAFVSAVGLGALPAGLARGHNEVPESPSTPDSALADKYFGRAVADPYRWLETKSDRSEAWLRSQDARAAVALKAIPGREGLLRRIDELKKGGGQVRSAEYRGGRFFYYGTRNGSEVLLVREADGLERVLVDPSAYAPVGGSAVLVYYYPSPDGDRVAFGVSPNGTEDSTLRIVETSSGKTLAEKMPHAWQPNLSWTADGKSFFYARLPDSPTSRTNNRKFLRDKVFLHVVGTDSDSDKPVFGFGVPGSPLGGPSDTHGILIAQGSAHAVGYVRHGVSNDLSVYAAPLSQVIAGRAQWEPVFAPLDGVTQFDVRGDEMFAMSHSGSPRFRLLKVNLGRPRTKTQFLREGRRILQGLCAAQDALYVTEMEIGVGRLRRVGYTGGAKELSLPFDGAVRSLSCGPYTPGAVWRMESWLMPRAWFRYVPSTESVLDVRLGAQAADSLKGYESRQSIVHSRDGTEVPLTIIHKKGIALDGSNPTWLRVYGAYGISQLPAFKPERLPWLELGGVIAVVHARGGGEKGEEWHKAAILVNKQKTVDDVIAAADYLVAKRYTSPDKLAGEGTSAGAYAMGAAVNQRPELFRAVLLLSGIVNPSRMETTAAGPANEREFGSMRNREEAETILNLDPYLNVKAGKPYPSVLLMGGYNDGIVPIWMSAKMAGRLQSVGRSPGTALLKINFGGGHGAESVRDERQLNEEYADQQAFLLWQTGMAGFQAEGGEGDGAVP